MTDEPNLSAYVEPHLSESRTSEQWRGIERRLGETPSARPVGYRVAAAFAIAAVAVVAFMFVRKTAPPSAWDGAMLDSGRDGVSVSLADGSHIELEPDSRVLVREGNARAVRLEMPKGGARFDVPHVPGRSFEVAAEGIRVRVVGTRFSVTRATAPGGHRIVVSVERGVVLAEPESGGEPARVRAGETWSTLRLDPVTSPASLAPRAPTPSASEARPEGAATEAAAKAGGRPSPDTTAQELFEKGNAARQAGDARGAAAAYEALLRHHASDSRAGLAAFELGRLKMDQLGDLPGAVVALSRAMTLAPGPGFREDALARLARAYGTLGNTGRCEAAQKEYLGNYPSGVHAAAVRKACGEPSTH